mmetsp:Transcript_1368/g.3733  ORF Transcript_1368/g.3733 Transcript_1368/m.3733 type:complete len:323 (+) Transcript_1368:199-1167(+)
MDVGEGSGAVVLDHARLGASRHCAAGGVARALDVAQALLKLLCKTLEERLDALKLLPLVVHLVCVVLVGAVDLRLEHPHGDAPQQEIGLDLFVDAPLHAHGSILMGRLQGLEFVALRGHLLLELPGLVGVVDCLLPALDDHRQQACLCGAVHAVEDLPGLVLLLLHVDLQLLLGLLHRVLKLLVLLVVLAERQPGGPSDLDQLGILVRTHAHHDLLRVVGVVGRELCELGLHRPQGLRGRGVALDLNDLLEPGLDHKAAQGLVPFPRVAHEHALHARQLLLLVLEEPPLRVFDLLLKLLPEFPFSPIGQRQAQPRAEGGVYQ